jgi:hypothetical protein
MRVTQDEYDLVCAFCRAAASEEEGLAWLSNMRDAINAGDYPEDLAADFLFECAGKMPSPDLDWQDVKSILADVAWSDDGKKKYRFKSARHPLDAKPLLVVKGYVDVAKSVSGPGEKSKADKNRSVGQKPVPSLRFLESALEHCRQMLEKGYRPGAEQGIFWASRYYKDDVDVPEDMTIDARNKRATRWRNHLGLHTIGEWKVAVEIVVNASVVALRNCNHGIARPTFVEGLDMPLFRHHATATDGWGRSVDLSEFCLRLEDPCEGGPEIVLAPVPEMVTVEAKTTGYVTIAHAPDMKCFWTLVRRGSSAGEIATGVPNVLFHVKPKPSRPAKRPAR